ncbi:MAG: hypothetical protein AAF922_04755 [Pseudomonadota bacterium]
MDRIAKPRSKEEPRVSGKPGAVRSEAQDRGYFSLIGYDVAML